MLVNLATVDCILSYGRRLRYGAEYVSTAEANKKHFSCRFWHNFISICERSKQHVHSAECTLIEIQVLKKQHYLQKKLLKNTKERC